MNTIIKRDGRVVPFERDKIAIAMQKAFVATKELDMPDEDILQVCMGYAASIETILNNKYEEPVDIEIVQDEVERILMPLHPHTAKAYILYRKGHDSARNLMKDYDELIKLDSKVSDVKRENANIDGDTAMGIMLKFGAMGAKQYYNEYMLSDAAKAAHTGGDIHMHDLDFYSLTTTCTQIDIEKLFEGGFSTGHGFLREPQSIISYAALAAIAIQSNQNDQHGGQSIPNFDHALAKGVRISFRNIMVKRISEIFWFLADNEAMKLAKSVMDDAEESMSVSFSLATADDFITPIANKIAYCMDEVSYEGKVFDVANDVSRILHFAKKDVENQTHQAMEAFVHNLNTMHSRAGAQVPFSSINYGTNTTPEGRMVIRNILLATKEGLGNGETPIFPIQIFRVKKGINFNEGDPNYDLFKLACEVSAKRLFPNFSFQDAPFNIEYYDPERTETEIAYMGCRTRVMGNVYDLSNEVTYGRGNLSFTSINLPRIAIEASMAVSANPRTTTVDEKMDSFYSLLDKRMNLVVEQLLDRFKIQCAKKVRNYPFLMGQGVWIDSDKLDTEDSVAEILKHGSLSIGFIGLAEALTALVGHHHGENEEAQKLGLEIIEHMRNFCDQMAVDYRLNFTLIATPAEGLSGRFVGIDKKRYGVISGITDKEYYTNSFHIPVNYSISAFDKIRLESPYHELTNAGHITYVEMDGDPTNNMEAFEAIIRHMAESGIGYGAINHPVDRDPVCGYSGVINDVCPKCGRRENDGPPIERIRRITGYLVGTTDRFNNAKQSEERNRVKHI